MSTATLARPDTAIKPGIYPGMPFSEYLAIDAANNSLLKLPWDTNPSRALYMLTHPKKETVDMMLGTAAHTAVLEPDRFETEYACMPKFDGRTNAGKAAKAEWEEKHPNHIRLTPDQWALVTGIRDSVLSHPDALKLLMGKGENEATLIWEDSFTGLLCKARVDRWTIYDGDPAIVDFKTCRDDGGSADNWPWVSGQFQYYQQAAYYRDGYKAMTGTDARFIFMTADKEPPYSVNHHEPDDSDLDEGQKSYWAKMAAYAKCMKTGEFPGYPRGINGYVTPAKYYRFTTHPDYQR